MNYVLAAVLFFMMLMVWGEPYQVNKTQIGEVLDNKPAAKAGLKPGDSVVSVDDQAMEDFISVAMAIRKKPDVSVKLVVKREDQELIFNVIPEKDATRGGVGMIGIKPATPIQGHTKIGVLGAGKKALWQCWNVSQFTVVYLAQKIYAREKPDVAGPVGITQVIVKAVKAGWEDFLFLIAMISLAIGLFNLFPIPMLDGSHVVYYLLEGIRGKPLTAKTLNRINTVGMVLLLALMVFATINDIQRIGSEHSKPSQEQKK